MNKSADAPRVFREAAEAYEVLRDASSRRAYDASGARAGAGGAQQQQQQQQQQQYQQRRPQGLGAGDLPVGVARARDGGH